MLKFGKGNAKLGKNIYTFSLPSGWSCPNAKVCLSKATEDKNGKMKIKDGKYTEFRCFSASTEVLFKNVYKSRMRNFKLLKSCGNSLDKMVNLIVKSLPKKAEIVRISVAGDFYNETYFQAWLKVAERFPNCKFYCYTKMVSLVHKYNRLIGNGHKPGKISNFIPTASYGGKEDYLIDRYGIRSARVVYSVEEAAELGLEIDNDDSLAMNHGDNFALLLHGVQKAGTIAAKAWHQIKSTVGGYSREKINKRISLTTI